MTEPVPAKSPVAAFLKLRPFLYHFTHEDNLPSIRQEKALLPADCLTADTKHIRPTDVRASKNGLTTVIRNQRPLNFKCIQLVGGWDQSRLLEELGRRIFFFPGSTTGPKAAGLAGRYPNDILLRVTTASVIDALALERWDFTTVNSGASRMQPGGPVSRGPDTFLPAGDWVGRAYAIQEVCHRGRLALPPHTELLCNGAWDLL